MKKIFIATVGKTVGLKGDMKLHLQTDFDEQFVEGAVFATDKENLTIKTYNPERGLVRFMGYETPEVAKKLTNKKLYTTIEQSRQTCPLEEDEFFWFDIIGCSIIENDVCLGKVLEINRLVDADFLVIETDSAFSEDLPKQFLLPYIERYIVDTDIEAKTIFTKDAKDILENS